MQAVDRKFYIEDCKVKNAEFIKYFNPLIVYIRKGGYLEYNDGPQVWKTIKELALYDNVSEIPNNLWDEFLHQSEAVRWYRGKPVGVVVIFNNEEGDVCLGWSKCNLYMGDKWDRHIAIAKATKKAEPGCDWENDKNVKPIVLRTIRFALDKWRRTRMKKQEYTFNPSFEGSLDDCKLSKDSYNVNPGSI